MIDWSTGDAYDAISFVAKAQGLKNGEAIRRFVVLANGHLTHLERLRGIQPRPMISRERPKLSFLRKATRSELQQIASSRQISTGAVELAQALGTLRVGEISGFRSWILFDESGLCAEGRRLNRKLYPAVMVDGRARLSERKAHTLRWSRKDWPVGILPTKEFRQNIAGFLLVEGGPDYLASLHFSLMRKRADILPVAILGRTQALRGLHPDSLQYFRNRRVRIVPHHDSDGRGLIHALCWGEQLEAVGCKVDFFSFEALRKTSGEPVKDLNDCVMLRGEQAVELEALFP